MASPIEPAVFPDAPFPDYSLLDSGRGEKLERFGPVVVRRPDPQAIWAPRRPDGVWAAAHIAYERDPGSGGKRGRWVVGPGAPEVVRGSEPAWSLSWGGVRCVVRPTPFKHVGLFPEQAANWAWIEARRAELGDAPALLNLFGYTGIASVVAARAGYAVTHVDASRTSLAWARENAEVSGLGADALRIVLDDALAFARREVRRGREYAGILLDPPHHGRGPKGETWQFEEHAAELVAACRDLLGERAFLVLSTYAFGTSPLALEGLFAELGAGELSVGELALTEEAAPDERLPPRRLPCGFCARWTRGL